MAKNWIQEAHLHEGTFTKKAKAAGMGVQSYAAKMADAPGKTGKQARLAQTFAKLHKAATGAVIEVESPEKHRSEKDEPPLSLDSSQPSMVLVGDGGKDPAAEEYLYIPPGSQATVAPKSSPNEKPSVSNGLKAIANIQLKKAAVGLTPKASTGGSVSRVGIGSSMGSVPGVATSVGLDVTRPSAPEAVPVPSIPYVPVVTEPTTTTTQTSYSTKPAAPYDPGVGVEPTLTSSNSLIDTLQGTSQNPMMNDSKFTKRPGNYLLKAMNGLLRAQYGAVAHPTVVHPPVIGYTPSASASNAITPYQQAQLNLAKSQMNPPITAYQQAQLQLAKQQLNPPMTAYQQAQLDLQRQQLAAQNQLSPNTTYATDAQKWIAQQQIAAQNAQNAAMMAYNRDRLALDKLLGEKNAQTEANRQQQEAMQLLMTRAGRQMVAPGGNVIPSMQGPLRGGTIN